MVLTTADPVQDERARASSSSGTRKFQIKPQGKKLHQGQAGQDARRKLVKRLRRVKVARHDPRGRPARQPAHLHAHLHPARPLALARRPALESAHPTLRSEGTTMAVTATARRRTALPLNSGAARPDARVLQPRDRRADRAPSRRSRPTRSRAIVDDVAAVQPFWAQLSLEERGALPAPRRAGAARPRRRRRRR